MDMLSGKTLLQIEGLTLHYGPAQALFGIDLEVTEGETVAIVGANGAGKSSLLKAIAGIVPPSGGRILLDGQDVTGQPASRMACLGVTLSPEGREMFGDLSVRENLVLGALAGKPSQAEAGNRLEAVFSRFPKLRERIEQPAATLSGGEQQMVAIGRALMARPRLLLLDEPSLGLAPLVTDEIFDIIRRLARAGTTILLVEQNAARALTASATAYLLANGRIVRSGKERGSPRSPGAAPRVLGGGVQKQPGPEPSRGCRLHQCQIGEARHEQTDIHASRRLGGRSFGLISLRACNGPCGTPDRARRSIGPDWTMQGSGQTPYTHWTTWRSFLSPPQTTSGTTTLPVTGGPL